MKKLSKLLTLTLLPNLMPNSMNKLYKLLTLLPNLIKELSKLLPLTYNQLWLLLLLLHVVGKLLLHFIPLYATFLKPHNLL